LKTISHTLYQYLLSLGLTEATAKYTNMIILSVVFLAILLLLDYLMRKLLVALITKIALKSKTRFDNFLVKNQVPRNLAHIIPLILAFKVTPIVFTDFKPYAALMDKGLQVCGVILTLLIARRVLNTLEDYFKTRPTFKDKPIDSYIQVFMIFGWILGIISVVAILTGMELLTFVTGLGAASAVILLIFKDTILGFVASIQVSINDMVRIGDWITFDKYGTDGDVIEINLATVKVQNFDKTITTIPTYALISDSFKNWRGMMDSDGRRIKRSVKIKQDSVRFVNEEDLKRLGKIQLISSYIESRQKDVDSYNKDKSIDTSLSINGRNLTNIGLFRKYLESYLQNHPAINKDMTLMVRQLEPTGQGWPIEVYAFSQDKRWENYEYIMADIFDHIVSSVSYFDLELFEFPNKNFVNPLA
jgi:miniconductance mechanosensitive channel